MIVCKAMDYDFPPMPLKEWESTKETLHLFAQIVGKIRLTTHPKLNHWWHVTLYPSVRGFTTYEIPYCGRSFEIEFDFIESRLRIKTGEGTEKSFPLTDLTVADFYRKTLGTLAELGFDIEIYPYPYLVKSKIPFPQDTEHHTFDPEAAHRYWRVILELSGIFEEFRGRFCGKSTPVHLFWHSFDMALTRFSGRPAPPRESGTKVDREAYSHEVISFGFWAGDDNLPEPAFYSYTSPAPEGLPGMPLKPDTAFWGTMNNSPMALLKYEDFRKSTDPRSTLLDFLESAYQAGAVLGDWPIDALKLQPVH